MSDSDSDLDRDFWRGCLVINCSACHFAVYGNKESTPGWKQCPDKEHVFCERCNTKKLMYYDEDGEKICRLCSNEVLDDYHLQSFLLKLCKTDDVTFAQNIRHDLARNWINDEVNFEDWPDSITERMEIVFGKRPMPSSTLRSHSHDQK